MKRFRTRGYCLLLLGACAHTLAACGAPEPGQADVRRGTVRIGRAGQLNGVHFYLEAKFDVSGPETFSIDSEYTTLSLTRELTQGAYSVTIEPGFRVLRDAAVAEVPVANSLISDATQPFQISPDVVTSVAYRFTVDGGTLVFDAG